MYYKNTCDVYMYIVIICIIIYVSVYKNVYTEHTVYCVYVYVY